MPVHQPGLGLSREVIAPSLCVDNRSAESNPRAVLDARPRRCNESVDASTEPTTTRSAKSNLLARSAATPAACPPRDPANAVGAVAASEHPRQDPEPEM